MNVLVGFMSLMDNAGADLRVLPSGKNRANSVGAAFELFVKEAFADILGEDIDEVSRDAILNQRFSWLGDDNKSPDALLRGGIALEIKKSESLAGAIQLNSSPPRQKLLRDDPRVSTGAKNAENWVERDLAYVVGHTSQTFLERVWIVYGDCLAANAGVYSEIFDLVKESISSHLEDGILEEHTTELAKLKKVDPQDRSDLRVRPMWSLESPDKAFSNLIADKRGRLINLLLRESTYRSLPETDRRELENRENVGLRNTIVSIPDPDNAGLEIEARFISYEF